MEQPHPKRGEERDPVLVHRLSARSLRTRAKQAVLQAATAGHPRDHLLFSLALGTGLPRARSWASRYRLVGLTGPC